MRLMHHGLAVFTTRWGAHFGGINTFNVDLCSALAETVPVWCIVLTATHDEIKAAGKVSLLSLSSEANELDVAMAEQACALLIKGPREGTSHRPTRARGSARSAR